MSWRQATALQFNIKSLLILTLVAAVFIAVAAETNLVAAILAIGFPFVAWVTISTGMRIKNDRASDLLVKTGAAFLVSSLFVAFFVWLYVLFELAQRVM